MTRGNQQNAKDPFKQRVGQLKVFFAEKIILLCNRQIVQSQFQLNKAAYILVQLSNLNPIQANESWIMRI